ncbi:MAG: PAS domain S-box protein [Planctomycetes bacterium]|nr:PAS domain S-box protein [Planctomycetota bacterium]
MIPPSGELRLLNEIIQKINSGMSLDEVFNLIYDRLREFVPYHRIAVALVDPKREILSITAAKSDGKMVLTRGYTGVIAGSSLEPLVREGRTRIINDLQEYLARKPSSDSTRLIVKEGMRSSLTLPLLVEGQPIGVMFFSSRLPDAYRPAHEEFLRGIVGHVAMAIERSRLMDALREKSDYLENILNNSTDAIVVVDMENRIRTWNEGARRIFGYDESEVLGKHVGMLVAEEGQSEEEMNRIRDQVERDGFLKDYECVRRTKDGRKIISSITSTLLRDKQGRAIGRSSIVRDVTRLRKLQEDLVKSQSLAAVGELAATVAHEIKNPLAGISGAIQVLEDAIPRSDPRRSVVGEILEQIRRLDNTVRDLLAFSRPTAPVRQEIDVGETLARAWSLLAPQPGASEVRFAIAGGEGMRLLADAHLLEQVWINLFQNAIEAMPRGGELRVLVHDGESIRIEVRDTGSGIDAAHVGKLFRPFFSTKTRGTGLGLAISRKIVEAHGGSIWFATRPGIGTSVFVELPQ